MRPDLRRVADAVTLGAALASIAYGVFAVARLRRFAREVRDRPAAAIRPSVTVLKPVCGVEPGLEENLRSFCDQDYPDFHVVMGVAGEGDPALPILRRVAAEYAGRATVVVGDGTARALNPKVANLIPMLAHARGELLVIADADMRVTPDYLDAIAVAFEDPSTGAVTAVYRGEPADDGLASVLGAMCFAEQFAPSVLVAHATEPLQYTFGSAMAVRRALFDAIGGFDALGAELADDFALGRLVSERSRVALARYVVTNVVSEPDARALALHELRWSRTIRGVRPWSYGGIVLTYPVAVALLHFAVARDRRRAATVLGVAALVRLAIHRVAHAALGAPYAPSPLLVPLRDALSAFTWAAGLFGGSVRWRGRDLRVTRAPGTERDTRDTLIGILQSAYSGELAAAFAYSGHAASVKDRRERTEIERIEAEEWAHRAEVGRLLDALGAAPQRLREAKMAIVGTTVGISCHVLGWLIPMYFAGRLEHANIDEYAVAARCARELGLPDHERSLAHMASVEAEHEAFFRRTVAGDPRLPLLKRFFGWG